MPQQSAPPPTAPGVAVVTVSYGSGEALEVFLRSLREFHGDDLAVMVVDNKPDEENVEALSARFGAGYLPLSHNPGYGAGMNAGVAALGEAFDAYFFCNPDVRFLTETAAALSGPLIDGPRIGSIGPRLLNEDGTVYPSARNIPSVGTGIGHALFGRIWPRNPWTRKYQDAANYTEARPAGSLSGAAVMVKRTVFEEIGGWDETYFMHFEDIDLGFRIGLAGYENRFEPAVSLEHSGAHSTKKHAAVVERAMTASAIRFMSKRYPGAWNAPLRWLITTGLHFRGAIKIRSLEGQAD